MAIEATTMPTMRPVEDTPIPATMHARKIASRQEARRSAGSRIRK
jgi:hypothetical protein